MIDIKYSKAILNLLFGRSASGGEKSSTGERVYLSSQGVETKVTSEEMCETVIREDDTDEKIKERKELEQKYQEWKDKINATTFWMTEDLEPKTIKHTYMDIHWDMHEQTITGVGWVMTLRPNVSDVANYPSERYLALFTTMPNEKGEGFVEPYYDQNDIATTYQRVDLDKSFFSEKQIMCEAMHDVVNGGAKTENVFVIYYPEITEADWATSANPLVGFGIFESKTPVEGEIPFLWGCLSNEETVTAEMNHVPLFRAGEFNLSIS